MLEAQSEVYNNAKEEVIITRQRKCTLRQPAAIL